MTILFLSPHYDDAVYSCGGSIYQLAQAGEEICILTIMAGFPSNPLPDTPIVRDVHKRWERGDNPVLARREEDKAALAILGVKSQYLAISDCIYRQDEGRALYPDEDSLWGDVHPDDPAHHILNAFEIGNVSHIYAPLAVGRHVDHQLVRDWALSLQKMGYTLSFYEDYPYLRKREAIDAALAHFEMPMQVEETRISENAMQKKILAMAAYDSQISSFWESRDELDREVRETFAYLQGYVERTWGKQS